jgi:hypothetical protein
MPSGNEKRILRETVSPNDLNKFYMRFYRLKYGIFPRAGIF